MVSPNSMFISQIFSQVFIAPRVVTLYGSLSFLASYCAEVRAVSTLSTPTLLPTVDGTVPPTLIKQTVSPSVTEELNPVVA